ncbi:hypothetical protein pb186bvf_001337 [Paramecium bursaria]
MCIVIAYFGTLFLVMIDFQLVQGFLGYLVLTEMPFIRFKMEDENLVMNALFTSAGIYCAFAILLTLYSLRPQPEQKFKIYKIR